MSLLKKMLRLKTGLSATATTRWDDVLRSYGLVGLSVALVTFAWLGPLLHRSVGGLAWYGLVGTWALGASAGAHLAVRLNVRHAILIVLFAAAMMRLPLFFEPPYLSSDMYRYVWDGRVQRAGINPYTHIPAAPELERLRDAAIYPSINRADYAPTIYMPAAQFIFRVANLISDSVAGMKVVLLVFEAAAIAAMLALLRRFKLPAGSVAAYAWHPLAVWEIAGNGHVDAALLGLMTVSFAAYLGGRTLTAGAIAAFATLVKPTALLLFPVYWRRWDWRLPALLIGLTALLYVPYLSAGSKVFGFLGGYVQEEELSGGGGFRYLAMVQAVTGPIPRGALVYALVAFVILGIAALRSGWRLSRTPDTALSAYALLLSLFLLLLTPHYPWYYLALGPLLVLTRAVTPWVLMTGGFLLYDVIDNDRLPPFAWREGLLHVSALIAFCYDMRRRALQAPVPVPVPVPVPAPVPVPVPVPPSM